VLSIDPRVFLDMIGIAPLPTPIDASKPPHVEFNSAFDAWAIAIDRNDQKLRVYFDRQSLLPKRVELLSPNSEIILFSTLQRYASVTQQGMSPLAFPKIAQLIDIASPVGSDNASPKPHGEVKIAIDSSTSVIDPAQLQRIFDLDRLKQSLR